MRQDFEYTAFHLQMSKPCRLSVFDFCMPAPHYLPAESLKYSALLGTLNQENNIAALNQYESLISSSARNRGGHSLWFLHFVDKTEAQQGLRNLMNPGLWMPNSPLKSLSFSPVVHLHAGKSVSLKKPWFEWGMYDDQNNQSFEQIKQQIRMTVIILRSNWVKSLCFS